MICPVFCPTILAHSRFVTNDLLCAFLMFLSTLTVIGVLVSDIALAMLDPRIRLQGGVTR